MHVLRNRQGLEVSVIAYGGIITSIKTPDRHGVIADIVLGFTTAEEYADDHPYFGALIGRYANRIANARFTIDGVAHRLSVNDGPNQLHGGVRGFDKATWRLTPLSNRNAFNLTRTSPHGEEGYPGSLDVCVTYELNDANELVFDYRAEADRPTHVNLTQHSYFNLSGEGSGDVLAHQLTIDADRYTPVDAALIPTGEIAAVEGTLFDFRKPRAIGRGYDHNWVLNRPGSGLRQVAHAMDPISGRTLDVATTEPGIQFYTGNSLDGRLIGKSGRIYGMHSGFCLETQHFPDTPNQSSFPSTLLRPGERYHSRTVLTFGIRT